VNEIAAAPQIEAAYSLLGFIFDTDDLIEFRAIGPNRLQAWARFQDARTVVQNLATLGVGTHIYFGANPRLREGGKAEDVALARCLFADWDRGTTIEQARIRWTDACIPEPTVIVESGGGVHAWWRLQEPITDMVQFSQQQKSLAIRLGSDQCIHDAPRIMRLPGFPNWKYPSQPVCVVAHAEPDNIWSIDEFPSPEHMLKAVRVSAPVAPKSMSVLSQRFLHDGACFHSGRRQTIFTVACDLKARQWSLGDAHRAIMQRAQTLGLSSEELLDVPRQIGNAFARERLPIDGDADTATPIPDDLIAQVDICDLAQRHSQLRQVLIHNLLRSGETMNIISAPKMGKSWLVNDLAICVATGRSWLATYEVEQGRVLLIDNELHEETTAYRLPQLCRAKGISMNELKGRITCVNLRGGLCDFHTLGSKLMKELNEGDYSLVIFDAFYRFIPAGISENDNGAMAAIYNLLDSWSRRLGCAMVCIHHTSKGNQSEKSVTDVGAGAGSMARAADTHLVLRHHELADHVVLDAAVRSFPPVGSMVIRFDFPVFYPEHGVEPKLKTMNKVDDGWDADRFLREVIGSGCKVQDFEHISKLPKSRCKILRQKLSTDNLIDMIEVPEMHGEPRHYKYIPKSYNNGGGA